MTDTKERDVYGGPSPLPPTEAGLAAWHVLSREEQIAHWRDVLHRADCDRISDATVGDVLTKARQQVAASRGA